MRLSKSLKQLITNTARDAYAKGVADGERKILTGLKAVAQLNGSFGAVAPLAGFAKAEPDDSHALIVAAMLQVAEDAAEGGDDPADALRALAALSRDPDRLRDILTGPQVPDSGTSKLVQKSWREDLHPRDDSGRFIGKDKLQAAKSDPALAKQLRDKTTDPGERAKLDKVLSGDADPGRTKRGEARHQSQQRRAATESDRRRAHRLAMRAFEPGGLGYDDYEELADLLPSLTVEQLRSVRAAVGASWGGQRLRRQGMVDTLVAFARGQAAPPEQDAPGSPGWAQRMANLPDKPRAGVDAWESAKVDDAADRAERMGRWEADKPDSEAARAVAGAARAGLAGARGWAADVATATPGLSSPPPADNRLDDKLDNPGSKPRPKKRDRRKPVRTLADAVRRAGGINPASPEFLRFFANAREAVEYGLPLNLFNRETGRHPDQLVTELVSEGHLTVPDGADTTQYLFDQMVKGATSEHAILDEAKGKYLADLAREQDEYEAEHGTQPAAYEGGTLGADDLFADEDSGDRGAAGAAGEVSDGGEGSELGDFLGDGDALAFDFGANAEPDAGPVEPVSSEPSTPEPTGDGLDKVPDHIRKRLTDHLAYLQSHADELHRARGLDRQFGGEGRYESEAFAKYESQAKNPFLDQFRELAPKNGIDPDRAIREAGGLPDVSMSAEGQSWRADQEARRAERQQQPPAPAEPPMADPLMGRDAQLDIFGGSKRTPRPAKPAVQNSLIPRETERRVEGEETQRAIEAMRDAGNPPANAQLTPAPPQPAAGPAGAATAPAATAGNTSSPQSDAASHPEDSPAAADLYREGLHEIVAALMMKRRGVKTEVIRLPGDDIEVAAAIAYERMPPGAAPAEYSGWYQIHHVGADGTVKGAGTELIRRVLDKAKRAKVGVYFEAAPGAIPFYERLGFKVVRGGRLMAAGPAAVREMVARLTPAPSQPTAGPAGATTDRQEPAAAGTTRQEPAPATLPALTQPTPYGPQAVVSRGGLVVRDGTGGQAASSSPATSRTSTPAGAPAVPAGAAPLPPGGMDRGVDPVAAARESKRLQDADRKKRSEVRRLVDIALAGGQWTNFEVADLVNAGVGTQKIRDYFRAKSKAARRP